MVAVITGPVAFCYNPALWCVGTNGTSFHCLETR